MKKIDNNIEVYFALLFILIILMIMVYAFIGIVTYDTVCKIKGFEYRSFKHADKGYIVCCNEQYVNHIGTEPICEAVKVES